MRRVDYLLTTIRQLSRNTDSSTTSGIPDEEILQYLNDAQDRIQAISSNQKSPSKTFTVQKIITSVANQDGYSLSDRLFFNKEIQQIEYSYSGATTDYVLLEKRMMFNADTNTSDFPNGYYTRGAQFFPVPLIDRSGATFKVTYERTLDDLDKRRGKVSSVSGLSSTGFTSLVVDSTADESSNPNLSTIDYVCINSADGVVKAYNIPVLSYDTGTNVLTPNTFTFQTGETIAAGDYITFGKYTTTHPKIADDYENYLIQYSVYELFKKDSRQNLTQQESLVKDIEGHIQKKMASQTAEVQYIPSLDLDTYGL